MVDLRRRFYSVSGGAVSRVEEAPCLFCVRQTLKRRERDIFSRKEKKAEKRKKDVARRFCPFFPRFFEQQQRRLSDS